MSLVLATRRPVLSAAALLLAAGFAAGLAAGTAVAPGRAAVPVPMEAPVPHALRAGHPAQVLRVLDGDTFEARVRVWPGMDVTTKVRVRGIDAPELHARCAGERAKAVDARDALAQILAQGAVAVAGVTQDKYGGRVDADVSTATTRDVSDALLSRGLVRRYGGGRRAGWCG